MSRNSEPGPAPGRGEPPAGGPAVSVLGLGPMGLPIARVLVAKGARVTGWNRSAGPAEALRAAGGVPVARPSELDGGVVLAVLPDVPQLRLVLGLDSDSADLAWLRGRQLVVMSTTSPRRMRELAAELEPHGVHVLDSPMSGGDAGAAAGTLSLMVGGSPEQYAAVRPVLEMIGTTVRHLGPVGSGSVAKLCNQIVVASAVTSLGEALVIAERAGLSIAAMLELLSGGFGDSAVLRAKYARLLAEDYDGGGSARNQLKDLRYAVELAAELGVPVAPIEPLADLFERIVAEGRGHLDHTVVRRQLRGGALRG